MTRFTALLTAAVLLAAPVVAQNFTEDQIKALAIQAILENPQVVMEAVAILKEQ